MFTALQILIVLPFHETAIKEFRIKSLPIWVCDASSFDPNQEDKQIFLMLEGELMVNDDREESVQFGQVIQLCFDKEVIVSGKFISLS